jgi:DNA ligase-1
MRVLFNDGKAMSRSWKLHRSAPLQAFAKFYTISTHGYDGEVIAGHTYDPNVFRESMSGIRAEDGSKEFTIYLFDRFDIPSTPYEERLAWVKGLVAAFDNGFAGHTEANFHAKIVLCPTHRVHTFREIELLEEEFLEFGWEGGILRRPDSLYKYNRATANQGWLTKIKRFADDEAIITGVTCKYHNANEPTKDARGYTARSSHQENLVALDTLGSFQCQLVKDPKVTFSIGVFRGLDDAAKDRLWADRNVLLGCIVKFKHQGYGGGYDAPRTPVFIGFRDPTDM